MNWKKSQVDRVLDLYLAGSNPKRIAEALQIPLANVRRKLEEYCSDDNGRASNYRPTRRENRRGKPLTATETMVIACLRKAGVSDEQIARVLTREVREFALSPEGKNRVAASKVTSSISLDLLFAYRYTYYVKGISILPDSAYDEIEQEEREYGNEKAVDAGPSSDRAEDYPDHVRALGMYLLLKYAKRS